MTAAADPVVFPTKAHRIAAERAIRLAHEHGLVEALNFYEELAPWEQRIVFVLVAKVAGRAGVVPVSPVDREPLWWTQAELEQTEGLWRDGIRSSWVVQAHGIWRRQHKASATARETVAQIMAATS